MATPQHKVSLKKVAIAGAGGIGSFVAANLYDYGALRGQFPYSMVDIDIFDDDEVDLGNLLHQNYSEEHLGKKKAVICAEKYLMNAVERFMTEADLKNYDLVLSCVDSMEFRKTLYTYGWANPKLRWIDGRCSSRQIGLFHSGIARAKLESTLSDSKERAGCLLPGDKKNKVSHVTPQIIAGMMTQLFLNILRGEEFNEPRVIMI